MPTNTNTNTDWLTVPEIAVRLGLHPKTVRAEIARGRLEAIKVSKSTIRVSRASYDAWLADMRIPTGRTAAQ